MFQHTPLFGIHQRIYKYFSQVSRLIETAVLESDSPAMTAIALYHCYSSTISYDYSAAEDEIITDVSCYRGLMELSGICQSFAGAYAYLCQQCGIDAVPTSGITEDGVAHEWTLIKLDGCYYYADPTYENGNGGNGLQYFGITDERRKNTDGYMPEYNNIGNTNTIWGKDIDISDNRFAELWNIVYIKKLLHQNEKLYIYGQTADGTEKTIII